MEVFGGLFSYVGLLYSLGKIRAHNLMKSMDAPDGDFDVQKHEIDKRNRCCVDYSSMYWNIKTYIYKIGNYKWSIV
jgi:hypothetical protein